MPSPVFASWRLLPVILLLVMAGGCAKPGGPSVSQGRWVERSGGLMDCGSTNARLRAACESMLRTADVPVRLLVLDSVKPNAWSWPTGEVYVSSSLLAMLTDDEIAAVVGHELGHLVNDGHLHTRLALAAPAAPVDTEASADAFAESVLIASAKDARALGTALQKLAAHPATNAPTRRAIERRLDWLAR